MSECHDVYDLEGWPTSVELPSGAAGLEPWTVSLAWRQEGSFLHTNATLLGDDLVVEAEGDARWSADGTGRELAAARALVNLERAARVAVQT